MAIPTHSIEQEELMAYLDCELPVEQSALVAEHLEQCPECQAWAVESRALSGQLLAWQVDPAPKSLTENMIAAIAGAELKPQGPGEYVPLRRFAIPNWAWATAGVVFLVLLVGMAAIPNLLRSREAMNTAASLNTYSQQRAQEYQPTLRPLGAYSGSAPSIVVKAGPSLAAADQALMNANVARPQSAATAPSLAPPPATGPMIVRTGMLKLLTKDFDKTRAAIEAVVQRHQGYSAELVAGSEPNGARKFSANFRIPADQLDAVIDEIKPLAHVEQESQGSEEVTDQYADLAARLSNARRTEQTVLDLLQKRTGELSDVLAVEQELARVREQIESMEAQLKTLQNRVSYATLRVDLREEYKAELEMTPPSLSGRLRNAVVEGYRNAVDSLVGLVLFLLNVGPFLLLWGLILFLPIRYLWRKLRSASEPK